MFNGQYLRIERQAGGVGCTDADFIRSAHTLLLKQSRFHHIHREQRHEWLREGLAMLEKSRQQYVQVMRGASQ